jgi:glycosyltransferase involved in cell wall biosynthesis
VSPLRVLIVALKIASPHDPVQTKAGRLAPLARQIRSLRALGVQVDVFEITGRWLLKYLAAIPKVRRLAPNYDLLHAHYGFCGWVSRLQFARPTVISFMGSDLLSQNTKAGLIPSWRKLEVLSNRLLARIVSAVIVKSDEMAKTLAPTEAQVIPNGVDLDEFFPMPMADARSALGWDRHKRYVLFPGDPGAPMKGFRLAQQAIRYLRELSKEDIELAVLWGVEPRAVHLYMNASDALLLTSDWEGSPNVVKEALACSLPVAAVPVGDVQELLANIDSCRICERDPYSIAAALLELLEGGRALNARAGLRNKGLDLESVATRIVLLYESTLLNHGFTQRGATPKITAREPDAGLKTQECVRLEGTESKRNGELGCRASSAP